MNSAIIVAAGNSKRFGSNKLLADIKGKPLIWHTVNAFNENENIHQIILVVSPEMSGQMTELFRSFFKVRIIQGGQTRTDSVYCGLNAVDRRCNYVAVHDGARPFVSTELINKLFTAAEQNESAVPFVPCDETMYIYEGASTNPVALQRDRTVHVQTPQVFDYRMLMLSYQSALGGDYTDDSQIFLKCHRKLHMVQGDRENRKITHPRDLPRLRVGCGTDIHMLVEKRKLVLGGVQIPHSKGLEGHSDADVLVHAIMDALLSSVGERDIGVFFPNKDPRYKDISSMALLYKVAQILETKKAVIVNITATIIAQEPVLSPFIPQMITNIADILKISYDAISINATTTETLGLIGEGKGIATQAFCSVECML